MGIGRVRMKTPDNAQKPPIIFPARKHSIHKEDVRWISHRKFLRLQKKKKKRAKPETVRMQIQEGDHLERSLG